MINQRRLAEAKDNVLRAFKEWLQTNNWLFYDSNPQKQKKKEAEFKKILKLIDEVEGTSSLSELLGFTLWCQNYVANFGGVSFGLGIHGDPVKSFYITHARTDVPSSERLAQAMALVLRLQC